MSRANVPAPALHLDGGDFGISVRAPAGNHPVITVQVPLGADRWAETFNLFGDPVTLLAFAGELAAAVTAHVEGQDLDEAEGEGAG